MNKHKDENIKLFSPRKWQTKPRKISIVNDTEGWSTKWCKILANDINISGDDCKLYFNYEDMPIGGDIAFFLGCTRIASPKILAKNFCNVVAHASDLPKGRGFSPLKWQILEGRNVIDISLLEASNDIDAGKIYFKKKIHFEGHELLEELQNVLGAECNKMCLNFLSKKSFPISKDQEGKPTYYKKRNTEDQRINPDKTILEEFNKLRVADNRRFPAFFTIAGIDYEIKITKK